ncbi:MAG TPA: hypothetical protein VFA85_18860, partial [Terriglobales bacterium]|nr:hypothetical protein [Terriglobales bacterium]
MQYRDTALLPETNSRQPKKGRPRGGPLTFGCGRYVPFTSEQWVETVFHVPESLSHVSLQITVRALCLPW